MNIYIVHSKELDFQNLLYLPLRQSRLNSQHNIILPHEGGRKNSKDVLRQADLVIAEVSLPATGMGIELGWADMLKVPMICIHKQGTRPAGSLRFLTDRFIEYSDPADMISKLEDTLEEVPRTSK